MSLLLVEGENGGAASVIVQERRRVTVAHHRSRVGFSHLGLVDGSQPIHVRSATDPYSTLFTEIRIERSPESQSRGAAPVPAHLAGFLHKRVALDTTTGTHLRASCCRSMAASPYRPPAAWSSFRHRRWVRCRSARYGWSRRRRSRSRTTAALWP